MPGGGETPGADMPGGANHVSNNRSILDTVINKPPGPPIPGGAFCPGKLLNPGGRPYCALPEQGQFYSVGSQLGEQISSKT